MASARDLAAWTNALDELETELRRAEQLLVESGQGSGAPETPRPGADGTAQLWRAPPLQGSIPAELGTRAASLLAAQQRLLGPLDAGRVATLRQLQAVNSIPAQSRGGGAVYLDAQG